MTKQLINLCLDLVKPQFRLDLHHSWHGISHWARVWRNARELCEVEGLDPRVPCLFAFLHDSQRFDDGADSDHGHRARLWIDKLFTQNQLPISIAEFHLLSIAVDGHSHGRTEAHPIVQVCWDADRLDLGRVGIHPHPRYLCTRHAKTPGMLKSAWLRSIETPAQCRL